MDLEICLVFQYKYYGIVYIKVFEIEVDNLVLIIQDFYNENKDFDKNFKLYLYINFEIQKNYNIFR